MPVQTIYQTAHTRRPLLYDRLHWRWIFTCQRCQDFDSCPFDFEVAQIETIHEKHQ